ncbi:MAG TPA: hypothetical protein VFX49_01760 [Chloroflexota bacterium]|nr:hypothetical protein [Chloroflexota bacterium]
MAAPRRPDLDAVAWRVLTDLVTPDGAFATLPPDGLRTLIEQRLEREATRLGVPLADLAIAFENAMVDLTGARRPAEPGESV